MCVICTHWPIGSVKSLGVGVGNGKESFGTILIAPKHDFFLTKMRLKLMFDLDLWILNYNFLHVTRL